MTRPRPRRAHGPGRSRTAAVVAALTLTLSATAVSAQAAGPVPLAASSSSCSAGYVGLTFDDGPSASTSRQLIDILQRDGATATMFVTGQAAQQNPGLLREYAAAGLAIGNHSWDHPYLTRMSEAEIRSQLTRTQDVVRQAVGTTPELFRPPYGDTNGTLRSIESSLGLTEVLWDVDSTDYNNVPAGTIRQAASRLTDGQVILMHDWPSATVEALPGILSDLRSRNLCPGAISPSTGRAVAPEGTVDPTDPPPTDPKPTDPPPTDPPTDPTPTEPPPVGDGSCTAELTVANRWGGGFQAEVAVTAGSSALNGWTVTVPLPSGSTISQAWNGQATGSNPYTVTNAPYNGSVGAGQSTTFGFVGNGSAPSAGTLDCS